VATVADPRPEALAPPLAAGGRVRGLRRRLLLDLCRTAAILLLSYGLFFNLSVVRGSSMAPGIHDGDRILVEPWSYLLGEVERGDVVVLRYPLDPSVDYIKRVIGLPGDQIVMVDGRVWVNGGLLDEPYVLDADRDSYLAIRVRAGCYFVLGDNRRRSSDSREFGLVPAEFLRGRVDLRLWPPSRAGVVE
jgi:signal peptidase I